MEYNEFTLDEAETQFGLRTDTETDYFAAVAPISISELLRGPLEELAPLAVDIGTEKARSEFIIAPILAEVRRQYPSRISLFSGVEFSPDPERGLRGVCDYLLSLSPEQLTIKAPVVAVVEAKNDNIKTGWGQCAAEMVAAQTFNHARGNSIKTVYGVVTTGSNWRFLRLHGTTLSVDRTEYYLREVEKIVGILLSMLREASSEQQAGKESGA
jgi:hypothetical protein